MILAHKFAKAEHSAQVEQIANFVTKSHGFPNFANIQQIMNTFGRIFRITIYGESHGPSVGIVIDGCSPGIELHVDDLRSDLSRRKSGQKGTTARTEEDIPAITSGVYNGKTTGAPIHISFANKDVKSEDYKNILNIPRPGHADFTAYKKYEGFNDPRGGGHFSGRLTVCLVAAGVVAKKIMHFASFSAKLIEAGGSSDIEQAVDEAVKANDSIGGIVECTVSGLPVGLGEPFFDSAESLISHLAFSVPAIKGIEFGSGFRAVSMTGSEHNDPILPDGKTATNNAGGINGGITNGNDLIFRVAVKPASSIIKPQQSIDLHTNQPVEISIKGRHDVCIALRVPVIMEAVAAIVLADCYLIVKKEC
jgi:chorismate synthase